MNKDLEFIKFILAKHLNSNTYKAYAFGSRVDGKNKKFSDYDIAIDGTRLPSEVYFNIIADFEDSNFPYKVDLVQVCDLSASFKEAALRNAIQLKF
jgi:predicted nucleotidyltransferase